MLAFFTTAPGFVLVSEYNLNTFWIIFFLSYYVYFRFYLFIGYTLLVTFPENIQNPQYDHQPLPKWLHFFFWDALTALTGRSTQNISSYAF